MTQNAASEPQASALAGRIDAFLRRRRSGIIALICGYALVRILIFSAAFPLFNPLDEQDHFETIRNYAAGRLPGKELPLSDPEMARVFALYGSPVYWGSRQRLHAAAPDVPFPKLAPEMQETQCQKRIQ